MMNHTGSKTPGSLSVVLAFLTVYIVWGSTYFFIRQGPQGFPPFLLGAIAFLGGSTDHDGMGYVEKRKTI